MNGVKISEVRMSTSEHGVEKKRALYALAMPRDWEVFVNACDAIK
jgi:hypothetical protein